MKISMIGAGGWGIAMIAHLAHNNKDITLYCRNQETALALQKNRESKKIFREFLFRSMYILPVI